jgi:NADH:ubiquinone oxidoreductase subunit 2 (subunit N)
LRQVNIKRFLAYSSINNFGFILIAAAINSSLGLTFSFFYFMLYLLTFITLSSFFIFLGFNKDNSYIFEKIYGYFYINIPVTLILTVIFFSFAGIPPFIGFFAKLLILFSLIGKQYYIISFFLLLGSVFSSFYYIKIIKMLYTEKINYNLYIQQKQNFSEFTNYNYFVLGGLLLFILSIFPEIILLDSYLFGASF